VNVGGFLLLFYQYDPNNLEQRAHLSQYKRANCRLSRTASDPLLEPFPSLVVVADMPCFVRCAIL
jgi:hypothetical protein